MITKKEITKDVFNTIYDTLKLDKSKETVWNSSFTDLGVTDIEKKNILKTIAFVYDINMDMRIMIPLSRFSEIIAETILRSGVEFVPKNNIKNEIKKNEIKIKPIEPLFVEKIHKVIIDENWHSLLNLCDEFVAKDNKPNIEIYYYRSIAYNKLNQFSDCIKSFQICKDLFYHTNGYFNIQNNWANEINDLYYKIIDLEIEILKKENKTYDLLWKYNECLNFEPNIEKKYDIKAKRNDTYNELINNFGKINFENRKVLLFEDDLPSFKTPNLST